MREVFGIGFDGQYGRLFEDQDIARVFSFQDCGKLETFREIGGQIFQAMNCEVGFVVEEGDFEFLGEQALGKFGIGIAWS